MAWYTVWRKYIVKTLQSLERGALFVEKVEDQKRKQKDNCPLYQNYKVYIYYLPHL